MFAYGQKFEKSKKKRENAHNWTIISLNSDDLDHIDRIERLFNEAYESEYPFSFSKLISKCIEFTFLHPFRFMLSDLGFIKEPRADYRKTATLTDEGLIRIKELEIFFNDRLKSEAPFKFSKIISKCIWFTDCYFAIF